MQTSCGPVALLAFGPACRSWCLVLFAIVVVIVIVIIILIEIFIVVIIVVRLSFSCTRCVS